MTIWTGEIKELEKLYDSFKGQLPDLEKELEQLIRTQDANVVMLYSRRCLEVIITDLCENELKRPRKTEPLKGIIDKLRKEDLIPSHIITSMDHLNSLSSYGTHPKDFDPEQVKPVLNNLTTIIRWYLKFKDSSLNNNEREIRKEERKEVAQKSDWTTKRRFLPTGAIVIIMTAAAILAYPRLFKKDKFDKLRSSDGRISVAVMPFQNMTNDTIWNIWQDVIQEILTNSLSAFKEIKVRQTENVKSIIQSKALKNYASITPSLASTISKKLEANICIYGNIIKSGNTIRLSAQLINSKTEEIIKPFKLEGSLNEENFLFIIDSLSKLVADFLIITKLKQQESPDFQTLITTNSSEASRYFIYGKNAFMKGDYPEAREFLLKSVEFDSNFTIASFMLAVAYGNQGFVKDAKKWSLRIYEKREKMSLKDKTLANWIYAYYFGTLNEAIKYVKQAQEIDDQNPWNYYNAGDEYNDLFQYDKAIPEFEKSLEIYDTWGIKPPWYAYYTGIGFAYHNAGDYEKERKIYLRAEKDFPNESSIIRRQAILSLSEKDTLTAQRYIEKLLSIYKGNSWSEASKASSLASMYSEAGLLNSAESYYRKAFSLQPENLSRMASLAWFLIDKNRNINYGLELIDKPLQKNPDNFQYLACKSWGLHKLGKNKEALDLMEKSWELRRKNARYDHQAFLYLEEVKKAFAGQK